MKTRQAELLLISVIIARSVSFLFSKVALTGMTPENLLGVRFSLAFLILLVLFARKMRQLTLPELRGGFLIGACYCFVMFFEMLGLRLTNASTTSLIENTAIIIVPVLEILLYKKKADVRLLLCILLTFGGVVLLSGSGGFRIGAGIFFCLLSAFGYAAAIMVTEKCSHLGDPVRIGIVQNGTMGAFFLLVSLCTASFRIPSGRTEWTMILCLALLCSVYGFTFQPLAQRYLSASRAAEFCALNPLSTSVASSVFLDERLGISGFIGAAAILSGLFLHSRDGGKESSAESSGSSDVVCGPESDQQTSVRRSLCAFRYSR